MSKIGETITKALLSFDQDRLVEATRKGLDEGHGPQEIINALTIALKDVGEKFEKGEFFLAELVTAGEAAKTVISKYLKPLLKKSGMTGEAIGKIAIGTVAGDIHDIGKGIVASMLFIAGFEVTDLGVDVPIEKFLQVARENTPDILAMSALLSTTIPIQREVIEALEQNKLREQVKVIVGGSAVTKEWAEEINSDGYAEDASGAVKLVKRLLKISEGSL
jgi:5-methyltetrahydrofolate--homocysteine methyltransferase